MSVESESFTRFENYMPRLSAETYFSIANQIPHDNDYLQSLVIQGSELDPKLFIGLNLVEKPFGTEDDPDSKIMFSNTPYRMGYVVGYEVLRLAVLRSPEYFTEQHREDIQPLSREEIDEVTKSNYNNAMSNWAELRRLFPDRSQRESVFPDKERINYDFGSRQIYLAVRNIVSKNYF